MSKIRNFVMASALAFATIAPLSVAEAAPIAAVPLHIDKSVDVAQVAYCGRWGCRRGRYWGPRRYYGARRYWGPRRVWVAPVIIAPRVIYRGRNAHVRWCLNRYASYNPRNNTFLSYDGYYKRCVSPY